MNNIQELGLELIKNNISHKATLRFKDDWFNFYIDSCGQRGHYIIPYISYGYLTKDNYIIKRALSFTNPIDEGKDKAILGVLNLTKCKVVSIEENKIEFENFTINLEGNPCTNKLNFVYE